jgi:hypothetical protein
MSEIWGRTGFGRERRFYWLADLVSGFAANLSHLPRMSPLLGNVILGEENGLLFAAASSGEWKAT